MDAIDIPTTLQLPPGCTRAIHVVAQRLGVIKAQLYSCTHSRELVNVRMKKIYIYIRRTIIDS